MKLVRLVCFIVFHAPGYVFILLSCCYAAVFPGRDMSVTRKVIQWRRLQKRGDITEKQLEELIHVAHEQFIRENVTAHMKYLTRISIATWVVLSVLWMVITYPQLHV